MNLIIEVTCCHCPGSARRLCKGCGRPICDDHALLAVAGIRQVWNGGLNPGWQCGQCCGEEATKPCV